MNGIPVNLQGLTFKATNSDTNIFGLEGELLYGKKRSIRIEQLSRKIIYVIDGKEYVMSAEVAARLSGIDKLGFITLFSILKDRTEKELMRLNDVSDKNAKKPYTYYSIGFGWSSTAANADVDAFNQGHESILTQHGCVNLGRDTSCIGTEHVCIATDTWACDTNPGPYFGNEPPV